MIMYVIMNTSDVTSFTIISLSLSTAVKSTVIEIYLLFYLFVFSTHLVAQLVECLPWVQEVADLRDGYCEVFK